MNEVPEKLNSQILSMVHGKLKPRLSSLLSKVFLIHSLTAVITLSLCPQFGFKLFRFDINLMHSFMGFGIPICNLLCGLFFTTTSAVVSVLVLNRDEIRAIRYQNLLFTSFILLSSIGFFAIMNPNLFLEFSFMWLLGALVGLFSTFEISSRMLAQT